MYEIDHRSDGNLMPFKVFKIVFPKWILTALHAIKENSVVLKTYKVLGIEQLGVSKVRCRHKHKNDRYSLYYQEMVQDC